MGRRVSSMVLLDGHGSMVLLDSHGSMVLLDSHGSMVLLDSHGSMVLLDSRFDRTLNVRILLRLSSVAVYHAAIGAEDCFVAVDTLADISEHRQRILLPHKKEKQQGREPSKKKHYQSSKRRPAVEKWSSAVQRDKNELLAVTCPQRDKMNH